MNMTHYMQLLADNQPWNLMLFMAIPIVLAETLAITELYILFTRRFDGFIWSESIVWCSCWRLLYWHHCLFNGYGSRSDYAGW